MVEDIEAGIDIAASPERVWTALTGDADAWLAPLAFAATSGQVFYMQPDADRRAAGDTRGATHCQVEGVYPPSRLVFSWYYPETPKTRVEITLAAAPGGTHVALRHLGWKQFDPAQIRPVRDGLAAAWSADVLPALKAAAERPENLTV
ncbi:MAG: SRPBCC domain-containing protein [Phenylobacterium sp.]